MKPNLRRRITLCAIKYMPSIMALTCSMKIFFLSTNTDRGYEWGDYAVKITNVALNILITLVFYVMGRHFGFCWKHRSLCRTAMWGYAAYIYFLIDTPDNNIFIPLGVLYVVIVLVMTVTYRSI